MMIMRRKRRRTRRSRLRRIRRIRRWKRRRSRNRNRSRSRGIFSHFFYMSSDCINRSLLRRCSVISVSVFLQRLRRKVCCASLFTMTAHMKSAVSVAVLALDNIGRKPTLKQTRV
jgi:hypothetical protein